MDEATKDLMDINEKRRRDSQASTMSSDSSESEESFLSPMPIQGRRNSLIDQFRDFLSRSVDFSFKIDNPFEKEMY